VLNTSPEDRSLLEGYLANFREGGDGEHFWAYEAVEDLLGTDPERMWSLVLEMLKSTAEPLYRAYVAAGPLEDLLAQHGAQFIERAEALATSERWFLDSLRSIYLQGRMPEAVRVRIERACKNDA
jgi:hypothetical protein